MTSKPVPLETSAAADERFPEFPPRDDMQNSLFLDRPSHQASLEEHFDAPGSTIVLSEIPVRWSPSQEQGHRIPDLLVAFGVNPELSIAQRGYSIRDQGKPPDFVLEVASITTGIADYTEKRDDYAAFGIPEYWRFDPSGGQYHDLPLAGDRLVDGVYQAIEIFRTGDRHHWGRSEVLGLYPCWEEGQLRWWDPVARQYLRTFAEERMGRLAAEERIKALEAEVSRLRGS